MSMSLERYGCHFLRNVTFAHHSDFDGQVEVLPQNKMGGEDTQHLAVMYYVLCLELMRCATQ